MSSFCCRLHKLFSKNFLKNTIRVSNCFNPDQDRHSVGPGLSPSCLLRLSAYNKSPASKERVNYQLLREELSSGLENCTRPLVFTSGSSVRASGNCHLLARQDE